GGVLTFSESSERFVSAIRQFVKQLHGGYSPILNPHRDLDESRDRLILVISDEAPDTIKTELRALLGTLRSCRDAVVFAEVRAALSTAQKCQLETLEKIIAAQCELLKITQFSLDQIRRLLRFIHVLPLDFRSNGQALREAHALLKQAVLCNPARSD